MRVHVSGVLRVLEVDNRTQAATSDQARALLAHVAGCLEPGGLLVLEYQPWDLFARDDVEVYLENLERAVDLQLAELGPEGELEAFAGSPGENEKLLRGLRAGDIVGEIGVLLDRPRTASVRARTEATLLALRGEALTRLLEESREARGDLALLMGSRLMRSLSGAEEPTSS